MKKIVSKMAIVILSLLIVFACTSCKKKTDKNSSESVSSVSSVSVDTSSVDTVSSETSSVSSTVSQEPVVSQETVSKVSTPRVTTPKQNQEPVVSQEPVVNQEPVVTQPVVSQETTSVPTQTNTWVCPNPSAHSDFNIAIGCHSASDHQELISEYQEMKAKLAKIQQKVYPEGYNQFTWCHVCDRPLGDGYNGTCLSIFENGRWTCHHYDTGETCQIHH